MKRPTVFLTGGTGSFGRQILARLAEEPVQIILLVRNTEPPMLSHPQAQVEVVRGDVLVKNFGWPTNQYRKIANRTNYILHAAASTRFDLTLNEARKFNAAAGQGILDFGHACQNLQSMGYVSTAFVAGKRRGLILEDELEHRAGFVNTYERSKYEAEILVRNQGKDLPLVVFRPALVNSALALNWCLDLLGKGLLPVIPGKPGDRLDIIDGKTAAEWIVRLLLMPKLDFETYHIGCGRNSLTLKTIVQEAEKRCGHSIPVSFTGGWNKFLGAVREVIRERPELKPVYARTKSFLPQLAYPKIFDNTHTRHDLGL